MKTFYVSTLGVIGLASLAGCHSEASLDVDAGNDVDEVAPDASADRDDASIGPVDASSCIHGLPSAPGPQLAKVAALNSGEWVELGAPAADPRWGRARGRSWTPKMPFASAFGGAFLYGEGRHGFAKPDGHYMDDLWFYDVNAHAWRSCYPGADTATLQLHIDASGFEVDAAGSPIPVAQQVHGYEMNTFDIDRQQLLSMPCPGDYWDNALPQRVAWLTSPPLTASPWMFETETGRWDRRRTSTAGPRSRFGDVFAYLPSIKKAFFYSFSAKQTYLYDPATNDWTQAAVAGPKPPFGIEATSCFDPKRNRLYFGGGKYPAVPSGQNALWIYDVATNAFVDPKPANSSVTYYPANDALMICDTVNDRVLVIRHKAGTSSAVHVYDPNTNAWGPTQPIPSALYNDNYATAKSAFFDPKLNAVFIYEAPDSGANGTMWAYRFRK